MKTVLLIGMWIIVMGLSGCFYYSHDRDHYGNDRGRYEQYRGRDYEHRDRDNQRYRDHR